MSRRRAGTRDEILDAADALFGTRGYRGTSVAMIAARVGITDAAVHYHFPTKLDLFWAVVDLFIERQVGRLSDLVAPGGLQAIVDLKEWASVMEERPDLLGLQVLLSAEAIDPTSEAHEYWRARYRDVETFVAGLLREAVDRGEIRADVDADAEASAMLAWLDGARLQWFYRGHSIVAGFDRYIDNLVSRVAIP